MTHFCSLLTNENDPFCFSLPQSQCFDCACYQEGYRTANYPVPAIPQKIAFECDWTPRGNLIGLCHWVRLPNGNASLIGYWNNNNLSD